jgi:hypothetical protein
VGRILPPKREIERAGAGGDRLAWLHGAAEPGPDDGALGRGLRWSRVRWRKAIGKRDPAPGGDVMLSGLLMAVLLNMVVAPALFLR